MTKADIVNSLANEHELSKRQANEIVDLILNEITEALKAGDKVQMIPFGSFVVRERKARTGRNPQTGESISIAARRVPAFQPGKGLKDSLSAPPPRRGGGAKKSSGGGGGGAGGSKGGGGSKAAGGSKAGGGARKK